MLQTLLLPLLLTFVPPEALYQRSDGSLFVGTDAGYYFQGDGLSSHVFIGPYAGMNWRGDEKQCPLLILSDLHGNSVVEIDRRGRVHRKMPYWKIREVFKHYEAFPAVKDR